jgi:hypothetical protein
MLFATLRSIMDQIGFIDMTLLRDQPGCRQLQLGRIRTVKELALPQVLRQELSLLGLLQPIGFLDGLGTSLQGILAGGRFCQSAQLR